MKLQRSHRPLLLGRRGAVATNHPVATQAGLDALRHGGNAADAAVAVALTLGVVEPHMSGLGGDGFYHVHDARSGSGFVYNGSGLPPEAVCALDFRASGMPLWGAASVSVPGAVGALHRMHARHGRRAWAPLCEPAIDAARSGFGVTHAYRRFATNNADKMRGDAMTTGLYLRAGQAPDGGDFIMQPRLGDTLEALAQGGAESFYRGDIARRLLADFERAGVVISAADLARCEPEEQAPIEVAYRGFTVRQTPPNSMGFTLLQELLIVEHFDLRDAGFLSADSIHWMVEAKKLSFVDRERFACDPRHAQVPLDELLSPARARTLASRIDPRRAADLPLAPAAMHGDNTTYFSVIDGEGNAVSAIQSLNNAFGAGVTGATTGVLLNNRMTCWHLDDVHANALKPGKRVRHTMNAPMVLRDGRVWAMFGTPGADDQVQVNLQMATALIDFDLDPQHATEAPRWSSSQRGQEANWPHGGIDLLTLEADFAPGTLEKLKARGHAIQQVPHLEGPCSVACIRVLDNGVMAVGSDPRRDGWGAAF